VIAVKGVLDGDAVKTFKGTIDFKNGAVGAKGAEQEEVLLLSEQAVNKTVPLILCAEEDVEGSHGASIGRVDEKHIFYMQSRGIPEEKITELMAQSKIAQVVNKIDNEQTVKRILGRLGRGDDNE
jgi:Fe-S cluster assembly scaffold protein SufB